jgi:hypothetical protein
MTSARHIVGAGRPPRTWRKKCPAAGSQTKPLQPLTGLSKWSKCEHVQSGPNGHSEKMEPLHMCLTLLWLTLNARVCFVK